MAKKFFSIEEERAGKYISNFSFHIPRLQESFQKFDFCRKRSPPAKKLNKGGAEHHQKF